MPLRLPAQPNSFRYPITALFLFPILDSGQAAAGSVPVRQYGPYQPWHDPDFANSGGFELVTYPANYNVIAREIHSVPMQVNQLFAGSCCFTGPHSMPEQNQIPCRLLLLNEVFYTNPFDPDTPHIERTDLNPDGTPKTQVVSTGGSSAQLGGAIATLDLSPVLAKLDTIDAEFREVMRRLNLA